MKYVVKNPLLVNQLHFAHLYEEFLLLNLMKTQNFTSKGIFWLKQSSFVWKLESLVKNKHLSVCSVTAYDSIWATYILYVT